MVSIRLVMKAFFDPAVDALTGLIKDQASQLENSCGAKIDVSVPYLGADIIDADVPRKSEVHSCRRIWRLALFELQA